MPPRTSFTCTRCWFEKVPAYDRKMLGTMKANGQPTESKLAAVLRRVHKIRALLEAKKKART